MVRDDVGLPDWVKRRVLLLNATYEPLTALPARRAVVLMAGGKADTVHDDPLAPMVRSAEWSVQLPSVIRLRTYVRVPYHARVPMTRAALMHRDGNRCAYCGSKAETIDHVIPRSRGGAHAWRTAWHAVHPAITRRPTNYSVNSGGRCARPWFRRKAGIGACWPPCRTCIRPGFRTSVRVLPDRRGRAIGLGSGPNPGHVRSLVATWDTFSL